MTVFYFLGAATAAWAVLLAGLGIRRHGFPANPRATRAVMAISAVLVAGSIGSAVVGGILEEEHEEAEAAETEEAAAAEEPEAPAGGGEEIALSAVASGDLAFDKDEVEAEAGPVTLVMDNPSPIEHNVSLEGDGLSEEGETVGQGGTSTVSAEVERGEYTFYCSVPGHQEGGMEGTLTVK